MALETIVLSFLWHPAMGIFHSATVIDYSICLAYDHLLNLVSLKQNGNQTVRTLYACL